MNVSVNCTVVYTFNVNVPDDEDDLPCYCDSEDPVYRSIIDLMTKENLRYDGIINSIVNDETGEILFEE